ncbi:MAG: hypothetical protein DWQ31_06010 [Planctomycetota bacterium]|nr:MAG: hypothetical protein DWQ31_06010 [Planctomycetota bacterium]REJ98563.1 MAG: hypothetical protein DWQ35_00765 [Planctomycetota bacterium]
MLRPAVFPAGEPIQDFEAPVWDPLFSVASGTWVDVPVPPLAAGASDVQLLAVRFVDPGHPESDLGPRYRLWLRNNSPEAIVTPFDVLALASNDQQFAAELPQASARLDGIEASEIVSVDLRLPVGALSLARDERGRPAPFSRLHVVVDSRGEISTDAIPTNNGAIVSRLDVLPVDPALFSADQSSGSVGSLLTLSGEGLGPEPGQVVVSVGDLQLNAQIEGWYDLGIRVQLPVLQLAEAQDVQLLVIRGDGVASNPLPFKLLPAEADGLPPALDDQARVEF